MQCTCEIDVFINEADDTGSPSWRRHRPNAAVALAGAGRRLGCVDRPTLAWERVTKRCTLVARMLQWNPTYKRSAGRRLTGGEGQDCARTARSPTGLGC